MGQHLIPTETQAFPSPLSPMRNDLSGRPISSRTAVVSHGGEGWGEGARGRGFGLWRGSQSINLFWRNACSGQATPNGGAPPPPPPPPPKKGAGRHPQKKNQSR